MEHKQSKPTAEQGYVTTLSINKFKMAEAMGLKIIASRFP
jgi:hypothetical protein